MELSAVLNFVQRNSQMKKAEKILLIISSVPQGKFCSLDFICENAMEGYDTQVDKSFRGSISAILSIMDTNGLIEKKVIPFDPVDRQEFAEKNILGRIIDSGPRKTKTVFCLSQKGKDEALRIQNSNRGGEDERVRRYN